MSLHPEIAAFLDLAEESQNDDNAFHLGTPERARQLFQRSTEQMRWPAPQQLDVLDLRLASRGGELPVRLYRPLNSPQSCPVLVYFHGGGYVVGSLDSHDGVCRELCARTPCAVLSVGYRLAPEQRFPGAIEDGEDVLTWLTEQCAAYGLDSGRLALGGDSVGATLATVLAIQASRGAFPGLPAPRLQLLCYPMADASRRSESMELFAEGYLLESQTLDWFYAHYARGIEDFHDWRFSPLLASSMDGLAPALVALAGFDPLVDEGRAYAAHLRAQGVEVELREYAGFTHDFLRMRLVTADVESIYDELCSVLAKALA
ncbi:alpha/beta hydrolase [Pseudomonas oryzihabitans]|uniref:Acetyl esterase n=1 Tax=Pseudomonas oryzihabitans TaxID=47885 RepID=A0AAJ2BLV3_9PSED|nr:alpha/beta hydrolase [Pseudomonas psychrotolerans]MDR6232869.1 acetyl esterase [Pseudomonas psychrotolerans]MDR6358184.1 acetyl esterase [Pseudomonas psychrotolerans]